MAPTLQEDKTMKQILLTLLFLSTLLLACSSSEIKTQLLAQLEADFTALTHPPGTQTIDSFSGVGNFSAQRQIFGVEGDYCDFWVVELRAYNGEAQAVYDYYQDTKGDARPILMFVETNQSKIFEQTYKEVTYDSYADAFALDFIHRNYLYRFPKKLKPSTSNYYFIYFLKTNVEVEPGEGC
jgi:hypothetical protein